MSLHYPPTLAGLAGLPITVLMLLLSARSGRLAQRIGPRTQLIVGPLLVAGGMLLLRMATPGAGYLTGVLPGVVVFGLGLSAMVAPVTATVLAAAPERYAGVASGVNNAVARTGSLLAVAVLPAAVGLTGAAYADPAALTAGWRMALVICAVAAVVGAVLALGIDNSRAVRRAGRRRRPTRRNPATACTCGVEGPPTHVRPDVSPAYSVRISASSAGSMLPPDTTATVGPAGSSSARNSAAAVATAPAGSATSRARLASSPTARRISLLADRQDAVQHAAAGARTSTRTARRAARRRSSSPARRPASAPGDPRPGWPPRHRPAPVPRRTRRFPVAAP